MYKQSPNRSHRSKGIKAKHILQICLLLVICFWLIYQVKHSHEKRKEFDTKDDKVVGKMQSDGEIQRFGRKDLPRVTKLGTNVEKHSEDEEEKEAEEEENKHEEDERDGEDGRKDTEEEDTGRGGGDDEIDEIDSEKSEAEPEHEDEGEPNHEEEQADEDNEREENEEESEESHTETEETDNAGKENHTESEEKEDAGDEVHNELEEKEDAGDEVHNELEEKVDDRKNDHNERDITLDDQDHDGGSKSTHEAREEQYKADDASSEVAHNIQTIMHEPPNLTTGQANEIWGQANLGQENEIRTSDKDGVGVQQREHGVTNYGTSSNVTVSEFPKYENNSTKAEDSSLQNSTLPTHPDDQPKNSIKSTAVGAKNSALVLSNGTQIASDSYSPHKATEEGVLGNKESSLHISKSELTGSAEGEKLENRGTAGSDESSGHHSSEKGANAIQHDPIDVSDTTFMQEEKKSRTDLNTVSEIRTEAHNTDNTMAE